MPKSCGIIKSRKDIKRLNLPKNEIKHFIGGIIL